GADPCGARSRHDRQADRAAGRDADRQGAHDGETHDCGSAQARSVGRSPRHQCRVPRGRRGDERRCVVSIKLKYPLAFNLDGEPVRIPPKAWAWRVRRVENGSLLHRRGGECKIVKGDDGSPLYIALDSAVAGLIACVSRGGLYRLDAVTSSLRVLREVEPI